MSNMTESYAAQILIHKAPIGNRPHQGIYQLDHCSFREAKIALDACMSGALQALDDANRQTTTEETTNE